MPLRGDYGFGSSPVLFAPKGCGPMVTALGKDGVVYIWDRRRMAKGPVQRVALAFPATLYGLTAWDPGTQTLFLTTTEGYRGTKPGLQALRVNPASCKFKIAWSRPLGDLLNSPPTVVNDLVVVATGQGMLDVFAAADGRKLVSRKLAGSVFAAPISVRRDIAVGVFGKRFQVFRAP